MKAITILLSILSVKTYGQEIDSKKLKEIEMYVKTVYEMNSQVFKKGKLYSKIDKEYKLPWAKKTYNNKKLKGSLDSLAKNASIEIKNDDFSGNNLMISLYFPQFINDEAFKTFDLKLKESNLINSKNERLKINKSGSENYVYNSSSSFKNNTSISKNQKTLETTFSILTENIKGVKGSIVFEAVFASGYYFKKIVKEDIGKSLKLNNLEFKVIDLFENKIVLDFKDKSPNLIQILKFANLDKNNHKIEQIPYFEFTKMKEDDKSITTEYRGEAKLNINAFDYDLFMQNPGMSFSEYQNNVHSKFVKILNSDNQNENAKKEFGESYIVIQTADVIENLYIYLLKDIQKEFVLKIE